MHSDTFFLAENISAGYGKTEIIHDITFRLKPHTITGLIGANGSGKTTLLKCIANRIAHSGSCLLGGEKLEELPLKKLARKISYIPQRSGIGISLPVLDVVLMGFNPVLGLLERPSDKQTARALDALETVGLAYAAEKDFLTLSEGQKQLVFLARTLIEDTALLILDEPDSALDFQNRYRIMTQLKEMVVSGGRAGLLCLHDTALALEFCQQLILLKDGRCVGVVDTEKDTPKEIEKALQEIYGNVSLAECVDKQGRPHRILLWEGQSALI